MKIMPHFYQRNIITYIYWDPVVSCVGSDQDVITEACQCDANSDTNECEVGSYCLFDGTCSDVAKDGKKSIFLFTDFHQSIR